MKNRLFILLLVCAFLVALAPGASAQSSDCLNLSESDCAALQAAGANSENLKSAYITFAFDFTLGGLESFDPSAAGGVEFHISGQGPFSGTGVPDVAAMTAGDLGAVFNSFNTQMDLQIDITTPDESQSVPVSFAVVDGTVYFQDPDSGQWLGMTGESIAAQFEQMAAAFGGASGGSTVPDPSAMMSQLPPELMTAISSVDFEGLAATEGFLDYQRLGDEDMMGQPMSPFQFSADFGALFTSSEFQQALNTIGQAAMTSSTGEEAQQAAQMMMILPMFLQGTTGTLNVTQWVGSTDQFIHKFAIDLEGAMDLSTVMAASGQSTGPTMSPITLDFHFDVTFDQINGTFDIVAPEGATIVTPDQLSGS